MPLGLFPYSRLEVLRRQHRFAKASKLFSKHRYFIFFFVVSLNGAVDGALKLSGLRYSPITLSVNFSTVQFDYRLLTEPMVERCVDKSLFVFIPSRPSAFEQREAIRQTWAHPNKTTKAAVFFVLGDAQNDSLSEAVEEENRISGDLIVTDVVDSYRNLSLKIYTSLDWYNMFCPNVPFALKIDDDSVAELDRLLHFVETEFDKGDNKTIYGVIWRGTAVNRDANSTWYVPKELYERRRYPAYCNGPAYMMTSTAAKAIIEMAAETPLLQVEDALFTGILASKALVRRVDKSGIFWWKDVVRAVQCDDQGVPRLATMYPYPSPKELFAAYSRLLRVKCKQSADWVRRSCQEIEAPWREDGLSDSQLAQAVAEKKKEDKTED
ncbi:hypothetical protein QR680_010937 [Steinernema hermaphroditum]|uniref:Hexosyltransferase n=1 Tax=Steinernema hermaphroditum TaxID=289476 RepID=A0AA39IQJ9_9BILA|nr:hypothetical protein QR680_010937 [Steinernema hermaphroditum]